MSKFEKIYHDGFAWNLTDYFDYIKIVADEMPPSLRDFAVDIESYCLHGNKTLHDARVLSVVVSKSYGALFTNGRTSIEVSLIDQRFEGKTTLSYGGVSSFMLSDPDIQTHGHADILLHEFTIVRPGVFKHYIVLDHGGEIHIEFEDFLHEWNQLSS
ncbi:MAG: hypothetical protein ACN6RD_12580 [Stenotrophomonas maltophilia]